MTPQHNSGPWIAEQNSGDFPRVRMVKGAMVAIVYFYPDARLIAAAPDMLAALYAARNVLDADTHAYKQVTAAIANATGEL